MALKDLGYDNVQIIFSDPKNSPQLIDEKGKPKSGTAFVDGKGVRTIIINAEDPKNSTRSGLIGTLTEEGSHIIGKVEGRQIATGTAEKGLESTGRATNEYFQDKYKNDDTAISIQSDGKDYSNVDFGENVGDVQTEGWKSVDIDLIVYIRGSANLLEKGVSVSDMKKYLGNLFNEIEYKKNKNTEYREKMNYYFYLEKNSLEKIDINKMEKTKDGSRISVRNREGNKVVLYRENSYEATLYHQKVYDSKGNFIGIKSPINPTLNQKYKSYNGYELVLSKDLKTVVSDQNNRGTFNWDSDNNLEHLNTDVRLYNEYGSGKEDRSSKDERIKIDEFIKGVWFNLKNGNRFERYIKENKIQIITPTVMKDYSKQIIKENIEKSKKMIDSLY